MRKYPVRARAEAASFVCFVGGERLLGHAVGFADRSMHFLGRILLINDCSTARKRESFLNL